MYAMALSVQSAGYKIIILTPGLPNLVDLNADTGKYVFNTIEYRSYYKPGLTRIQGIKNRYNIKKILDATLTPFEKENVCLICSSYINYNIFLHFYLRRHKIPALVDATEWYSSFQFKFGKLNIKYLIHDFNHRFLIPKAKNVICISKYLEDYYNKMGCNTIYLPPQIVIKDYIPHNLPVLSPVVFFYAGSIQKTNDYIAIALEGFAMLTSKEKERIKIIIAGYDKTSFLDKLPNSSEVIENLGNSISIIGRISKPVVQQYLSNAHFMFFLRPKSRYSTAGFPSKVPEAMASGVPVITNLTSDLKNYILELNNGLIVNELSAEGFSKTVRKALELSDEEFKEMSNNAYKTALSKFEYTNYNEAIGNYLKYILSH
jgi:glycosyltransferase involved in cell wall biosynthesis